MSETQDKLSWLAFRYVACELDSADTTEFESLLMTDQAAREAVASAVEQTTRIRQALAGAVVVTPATRRSNWSLPTTRVVMVTVGSCLTLLLALFLIRSSSPMSGDVVNQATESFAPVSPAQLAYAWAEARSGMTELQPGLDTEFADPLDSILSGPNDSDSDQLLVAPSWMLAALATMDGRIDSEQDIQE